MSQIKKHFVLIGLVILLGILTFTQLNLFNNNSNPTTAPDPAEKTASKQQPTSSPDQNSQINFNLDDYVKSLIKSTLGKDTERILLNYQHSENELNLHLSPKINKNFTAKEVEKELLLNSKKIIVNFFNDDKNIPTLILTWYLNLVDKKDGEIGEKVLLVQISRKTFKRINWKKVSTTDLPEIIDEYWIHPALK